MKIAKQIFTILSAILGGFAVLGAPVQGAHQGIHAYQAHEQQQAAHPLHARAAESAPQISDSALINLWTHNQFAPILRNPATQLQLYEAVVAERTQDPAKFDHQNPVLGHLIRDPDYLQSVLKEQVAHPRRFAHYHHQLLPFLFGYERFVSLPRASSGSTGVPEPGTTSSNPVPEGLNNVSGPSPPPSETPPVSIPEPPGIVLLVIGMGYLAARMGLRRLSASHCH
jgi:hypothetical protein